MSNKQAHAKKLPSKPDLSQFNQIDVALTDIEVQFIAINEQRKSRAVQQQLNSFAEILQHFVGLTAKKKNISFDEKYFAGVYFDQPKGKAIILLHKELPKAPSDVQKDTAQA